MDSDATPARRCSFDAGCPRWWRGACAVQAACWVDVKRKYLEFRPNLRRVYLTLRDLNRMRRRRKSWGFGYSTKPALLPARLLSFSDARLRAFVVDGWLAGW